ncbi:putative multidrug resistance protein [Vibrio ponticus]|nr:putative multidrug resistance protein [Vibrio ponticus]
MMANSKLLPLLIIFSLVPLEPLAIDVYLPSFPQMIEVFSVTDAAMRQTISIYILVLGVSQLIAGPLSDRFGRRFSAVIGSLIYALGSLTAIYSQTIETLYFARALQGLGASFTMITAMAWVRDNYHGNQAGKLLSYIGGVTSAIPTIAPLVGSGLATALGWQGGFYMMTAIGALLALSAWVSLEKPSKSVSNLAQNNKILTCDVKAIFGNKAFVRYSVANMLSFAGLLTYVAVAPSVAMVEAGLSQVMFSVLFGAIGGVQILFSLLAPKLIQRVGRKHTVLVGSSLTALAGIGLILFSSANIYGFFAVAAMASGGFSLMSGAAISLALEPFKNCAGLAASLDGFLRMVGGAVIVALSGWVTSDSTLSLAIVYLLSVLPILMIVLHGQYKRQPLKS